MKKSKNTKTSTRKPRSGLKTFTYYIPAPPKRNHGYREKEFDKIVHGLLSSGDYELVQMQSQSLNTNDHAGLFVVLLLKPLTKKAFELNLDEHEQFSLNRDTLPEGIELEDDIDFGE